MHCSSEGEKWGQQRYDNNLCNVGQLQPGFLYSRKFG